MGDRGDKRLGRNEGGPQRLVIRYPSLKDLNIYRRLRLPNLKPESAGQPEWS